jgi:hypothetical protein
MDHVFLTQKAIREIYGADAIYDTEKNCLRKVNEWMRGNDRECVSIATVRRAKVTLAQCLFQKRS